MIHERRLPQLEYTLSAQGWHIEAEGRLYRSAGTIDLRVSSGIDWFELQGEADFEGQTVPFPALLRTLKRGERTVVLDDGTLGVLPENWLERYGNLADLGGTR